MTDDQDLGRVLYTITCPQTDTPWDNLRPTVQKQWCAMALEFSEFMDKYEREKAG